MLNCSAIKVLLASVNRELGNCKYAPLEVLVWYNFLANVVLLAPDLSVPPAVRDIAVLLGNLWPCCVRQIRQCYTAWRDNERLLTLQLLDVHAHSYALKYRNWSEEHWSLRIITLYLLLSMCPWGALKRYGITSGFLIRWGRYQFLIDISGTSSHWLRIADDLHPKVMSLLQFTISRLLSHSDRVFPTIRVQIRSGISKLVWKVDPVLFCIDVLCSLKLLGLQVATDWCRVQGRRDLHLEVMLRGHSTMAEVGHV